MPYKNGGSDPAWIEKTAIEGNNLGAHIRKRTDGEKKKKKKHMKRSKMCQKKRKKNKNTFG
jgi:hypothetical protein